MSDDALLPTSPTDSVPKSNGHSNGPSSAGGPTPNPRSCVTCRRRKVKCNKKNPCSNCVRAKIECIFPGPGRAPRKSRKPADAELLDRLRRLEGVVSSLNAQVEEHEQEAAGREQEKQSSTSEKECPMQSQSQVAVDNSVEGLENRFGRLVVEKGRSRYINNSFWASLNNEVEDLKAILIEPSDDEDDAHSPESSNTSSQHQGFIFGYSSTSVDMLALHPPEQQARQFWETYKENVDPLVKVLHIPTSEPTFLKAVAQVDKVSKGLEPLLFAVYYGAVTSTCAEDCRERWGEDRSTLLGRYRFGLEQALSRANFLYCDEVIILQAFVIFLILLRRNDDARKIWTLTGLVVRIAQTLGIHRDGSHFGLPPFEIEMRRRLWWQVCILDARSSEDHGCDPTIVEAQFDTKMPLNVNDTDLQPKMTKLPEERRGFTDMTFCLIRFEVANIFRRILYVPPGPNRCTEMFAGLSIADKEKWIAECHERMEDRYLKNCDMSIPICWVTATLSRLVMSKMWLIVYHPHQRKDGGATLPQETKDKLFITSLENIEYSILLETEARTMKWGWLFRTYVQWHAIAFLLSELCVRTKGEAVERAWNALEATAGRWWFPLNDGSPYRKGQQGCLWLPLRKLLVKAKAAREKELALERASQALQNDPFAYNYPHGFPPSIDQPSSQNLDRLLRPSAPKLGETPVALQPSWPNSPSMANAERILFTPVSDGSGTSKQQKVPRHDFTNSKGNSNSPGQEFHELSSFGLDNVLLDVMDDMTFDGTSINSYPNFDPATNRHDVTDAVQTNQPLTTIAPHAQSQNGTSGTAGGVLHPTFGDNMFSNPEMDFTTIPATLNNNGQQTDSPLLDGGNMDWTLWDDMVNQYGLDGQPNNQANPPNPNGSGHLGIMRWF
ncbi:uncharacterized protein K460DRAFT_417228 [Cucurbitaria berberidis CBS 394.84]|uniref:Zn(2)-C6 fungal-type domain-containing protein n=1 Tax=Cucurbitaria berberidis CBS 394.84 TaxID=1168544 RepID=A0A9P4GIH0_9PLEO|nr:uncharacterized protein K460DRAFT_417228 [Cucurbitaria berberidis CBS 394.84]KAF1846074.1 hypothetical protein K460DRAFT_417228 [Cucurbitaria berberidis CBS 394.84]